MGTELRALRQRLRGVAATGQLTGALELAASAQIARARARARDGRAYADALAQVMALLCAQPTDSPWFRAGAAAKSCLVVLAGERGLAGGFAGKVFRRVEALAPGRVVPLGRKAAQQYAPDDATLSAEDPAVLTDLAQTLCRDFLSGRDDRLGVVAMDDAGAPQVRWLLPLTRLQPGPPLLLEPEDAALWAAAVPQYVAGQLMASVAQSHAAEVAARHLAMHTATRTARDLQETLRQAYARARQEAITREMTEIVAGAGDAW